MLAFSSRRLFVAAWIAVIVPQFTGCGGSDEAAVEHPKTTKIEGTITYNGSALEGATVTLVPKTLPGEAHTANGAFGKSDASGKFTMMTFEPGDGAVPGEYQIMVQKFEVVAATGSDSEENYVPPEEGQSTPAPKSLIPDKYTQIKTSGLTATIPDAESYTLTIELKD
jgi:hypothetical protein